MSFSFLVVTLRGFFVLFVPFVVSISVSVFISVHLRSMIGRSVGTAYPTRLLDSRSGRE